MGESLSRETRVEPQEKLAGYNLIAAELGQRSVCGAERCRCDPTVFGSRASIPLGYRYAIRSSPPMLGYGGCRQPQRCGSHPSSSKKTQMTCCQSDKGGPRGGCLRGLGARTGKFSAGWRAGRLLEVGEEAGMERWVSANKLSHTQSLQSLHL